MVEKEYREALDRVIRKAHENRNFITEEAYLEILSPVGMNDREDGLTRGYLDSIGIKFGEGSREAYKEPEFTEADGKYLKLYLEELEALPRYTEAEIYEAKQKAIADDDEGAQAVLMNHYLKNVVDIAKLYIYQAVPAEDLIGEGNIGLMTAIKALATLDDPDEVDGFVGKLIMDAMDEAIYEDTDIRQQIDEMVEKVNDINEKAKLLSEEMKRPVTAAELSEETTIPIAEIMEALRLSGNQIEGLIP
ncbi:MAG: hypothetical protein IJ075_06950 [Lachnospiraceae bacterium]|nr:hypothetical protein [Lachnospiraceae bacterium]MBQ9606746.1 hypothetical protein [Lachnospiraceae bacterium]